MSLKVWLPLDGDLRNLGASDVEITNNGTTIDDAGKIGKCYYFNGSAQYLQFNKTLGNIYVKDFSLCAWLKPTDDTRGVIISEYASAGASNVALELLANRAVRVYWNGSPDWNTGIILNKNEWSHIVITKQNNTLKLYVNGIYKVEKTTALSERPSAACIRIGDDYRGGTGVSYMGYMNDIRIYDHCLSAAEVHEIAQGLVLHYKLDNGSQELTTTIPSTNVYAYPTFNTSVSTGGWYHWGPSGHSGNYGQNTDKKYIYNKNNTYSHWIMEDTGTNSINLLYQNPEFEGGYRSLQAIIKEENGLPITDSICYPAWNARNGGVLNHKWTSIKDLGNGFYHCYCEGISQDGSNDLVGIYVLSGYKIYVSECYLENNVEKCSSIFSYSSNIIPDSSGYGHHATLTNGSLSTDTSRYSASLILDASTQAIGNPIFKAGTFISEYTWAGWIKRKYTTAVAKQIHANIVTVSLYTNFSPYIAWTSGKTDGSTTGSGAAGGTATILDEWVHMALTYKSGIWKTYINGDLNRTWDYSSAGVYIVVTENNKLGNGFIGNLSDIRIYATRLLDTDIKSLYNIGMKVDNLGGIHTFEFLENEEKESIKKTGQIITKTLDESQSIAKQSKNYGWFSPNFIEI